MSDVTREFFDRLGGRGTTRLPRTTSGSMRFDLVHEHGTDQWYVTISDGAVQVTRDTGAADCVVRIEAAFFDRLIRGEEKALPAWLRSEVTSEGEFRFIVLLERFFCQPPGAHHPRDFARKRGVHR